ncbi:MAG: hypothetical protein AAF141_05960 [Pseudomonadota bacterium]
MHDSYGDLPEALCEIADVTDLECALKIADAVGGTRTTIPARAKPGHWLTELVGLEHATAICDFYRQYSSTDREMGYTHAIFPRGPMSRGPKTRRSFDQMRAKGASVRSASRRLGIHERTGFRYNAEARKGEPDLFSDADK